jgi:homogentisate 1,2-dioxygenase
MSLHCRPFESFHLLGEVQWQDITGIEGWKKTGLWIKTEMGRLQVRPGEIVVLQLGIRFAVELPDGPSRGYVLEVFDGHFQLPDLGPIGN